MNHSRFFTLLVSSLLLLLQQTLQAQTPQAIAYQAVARDGNALLANQTIEVRFTISEGTTDVYQELHSLNTNEYGLFSVFIGEGMVGFGTFGSIDWSSGNHDLKVELDTGAGFLDMGTSQLASVPFSLYAEKANMAVDDLTDVGAANPATGEVLKWNGSEWAPAVDDNSTTSYNAGTGITISGSTISNSAPDQTVSLNSGGATSVSGTYPNFTISSTDHVDDADADPANELQTLAVSGSNLSISGGNAVNLPVTSYTAGTGITIGGTTISNSAPDQTVSLNSSGATSVSGSYPNFTISSTDHVDDADANPTNEIQTLSLSGNTLSLSSSGGNVNLSPFASPWASTSSNLYFNTGNVGIGDNSPVATLTVGNGDKLQFNGADGDIVFSDDQGSLRFANANGANAPMMQMFQSGTNNSTRMLVAHSPPFPGWGIRYNDTADAFTWIGDNIPVLHVQLGNQQRVGVGTEAPEAKLHVSTNSATGFGQLKLTETQSDYSRITMNNNLHSNFWDIAARTDTNLANAKVNIYHSDAGDVFSVTALGRIGVNDATPSYTMEVNGNGSSRIVNAYNALPTTTSTTYNYGLRASLSQAGNSGFPRLYNVYAISTDADAYLTYGLYGYASGASNNNYGVYAYAPTSSGYAGYFSGNTYCTGSYLPSDERLKSDISPLQDGLSTILQLRAKRYEYDREEFDFMNLPEGEQYGFLAQDLQQLLPALTNRAFQAYDEAKSDTPEGQGFEFTAVNYIGLIPIMVSGMQEQQEIIEAQEQKIESLEARLTALEALVGN